MFSIEFDDAHRIMHLRLTGFWSPADVAAFGRALQVATSEARARHGRFAILSDSSDFPVQSPEVSAGFGQIVAEKLARHGGPAAIVVGSVLNKMQVERSMSSPLLRAFLDAEAARVWLAEQMAAAG